MYSIIRFDTATRSRREYLMSHCPGWVWGETAPQYAVLDKRGTPADWPLIESYAEAVGVCRDFNTLGKDDEGRNETLQTQRMAGSLE